MTPDALAPIAHDSRRTARRAGGERQAAAARLTWRKPLLALHVAATVSVLGADLVLLVLGAAGVRGAAPATIYPALHLVGSWLVAPLAVVSLATGLLLGALTPWGVFRYWWVAIKLAITAALTAVVLFVLLPGLAHAASAAIGAAPPLTDAQRLRIAIAPAVASTLLVLNVVLAVYKPGWRLRASGARQGS